VILAIAHRLVQAVHQVNMLWAQPVLLPALQTPIIVAEFVPHAKLWIATALLVTALQHV